MARKKRSPAGAERAARERAVPERAVPERAQAAARAAPHPGIASRLDGLLDRRPLGAFVTIALVLELIVFRNFVFLRSVYLFKDIGSDSINSQYPLLFHAVDYLRHEGLLRWSFYQGMGQNLFGVLTFDPFLLLFWLGGTDSVAYLIAFVEIVKAIVAGLFFTAFLRSLPVSGYAAVLGGVLYTFSGYVVLGSGWYIFSYDAMCIAMLLWAAETCLQRGRWYFLPIPVALFAAYQPFHLYLYGVLLVAYAVVREIVDDRIGVRALARDVVRLALPCALGAAVGSVFLLSNINQLLDSPRVGGDAAFFSVLARQPLFARASTSEVASSVLRLFSSDMMGTGNAFRGWQNYLEAPLSYAGLTALILAPQYLAALDRRRRMRMLLVLVCCAVPYLFPYFRHAFWLFAGDYFRAFSFFIAIALIYCAARGLSAVVTNRTVHAGTLFGTVLAALALLYVPSTAYERVTVVNEQLRVACALLLMAYGALLLAQRSRRLASTARILFMVVACVEAASFANITVNKREVLTVEELRGRTGYNDYTREAIAFLDSTDGSFFRVMKDYGSGPAMHGSLNDGKVQRYRGTTAYHPFNQRHYIEFLQELELIRAGDEAATRWALGPVNRPVLQTLTAVRYGLSKRPEDNVFGLTYEHIADANDVRIYRNRYALPIAFGYDQFMTDSALHALHGAEKDEAMLQAVVISVDAAATLQGIRPYERRPGGAREYTISDYDRDVAARRQDTLAVVEHGQNVVRGTVTVSHPIVLFFSIPFDKGWRATVDGAPARLFVANVGFSGLALSSGKHTVELRYSPPYVAPGAVASLIALLVYAGLAVRTRRRAAHTAS